MEKSPRGRFHGLILTASSITGISYLLMVNKSVVSWISGWFHWCPTSADSLKDAEMRMLSNLKKPYEASFVSVKHGDEKDCVVRSLLITGDEKETPLVLLHGFASGIGLWILNLDALSEDRPLYAIDILGFGLSSRPKFSKDAETAENQLVESVEEWRKSVGLNQFILLGHSMGGFLAASYAIKYPDRVKHLILADPWGFPAPDFTTRKIEIPLWAKAIAAMLRPFNPLAALRVAGPWGPQLIGRLRSDILHKFESAVEPNDVSNYIYHCNAQTPSGEAAFKAMTAKFGWAKRPMMERISELRKDIPITFIYGSRSWIDSSSGIQVSSIRKDSFVEIKLIQGAGHHVYADKADEFNKIVCNICKTISKEVHLDHACIPSQNVPEVCV